MSFDPWEDLLAQDAPDPWEAQLGGDMPVGVTLEGLDAEAAAAEASRFQPWTQPGDAGSPVETSGSFSAGTPQWGLGEDADPLDSLLESTSDFGQRAAMGATMGWGDELVGAFSPERAQAIRDRQELAQERSPDASLAGDIFGAGAMGVATAGLASGATRGLGFAGKLAAGAGLGGEQAAVSAAGYADDGGGWNAATDPTQVVPGMAFGAGGEMVGSGLDAAGGFARNRMAPWLRNRSDAFRTATFGDPTTYKRMAAEEGLEAVQGGVPRELEHLGVVNRWMPQSATGYANRLQGVQDARSGVMGDVFNQTDARGLSINLDETENSLRSMADSHRGGMVASDDIRASTLDDIANRLPRQPRAPMQDAEVLGQRPIAEPQYSEPAPPPFTAQTMLRDVNASVPEAPMSVDPLALPSEAGPMGQSQARRWWTDESAQHGPIEDPSILRPPAPPAGLGEVGWDPSMPRYRDPNIGPVPPAGPEIQASSRELARVPGTPQPPPTYGPFDTLVTPAPRSSALAMSGGDALDELAAEAATEPGAQTAAIGAPYREESYGDAWSRKKRYEAEGGYGNLSGAPPSDTVKGEAYRMAAGVPREQVYGGLRGNAPDLAPVFEDAADDFGQAALLGGMARNKAAGGAATGGIKADQRSLFDFGGMPTDLAANLSARSAGGLDWLGNSAAPKLSTGARAAGNAGAQQFQQAQDQTRGYLLPDAAFQMMQQPGALGPYEAQFWEAYKSPDSHATTTLVSKLSNTDKRFAAEYLPKLRALTAENR